MFAVEAGLFKDRDGDQHSTHWPVAHHWRHAEWLWGIQPEVWLWGRPRLFPRLDTPQLPAEGQGQRVYMNTHMLRSNNLYLLLPAKQKNLCFSFVTKNIGEEEPLTPTQPHPTPSPSPSPSALSWERWPGETTPRPCRARFTWLWVTSSDGSDIRKKDIWCRGGQWRTFSNRERIHSPRALSSLVLPPPTMPPSLGAPGVALNTTTEVPLCRVTKHSRCYKKSAFW